MRSLSADDFFMFQQDGARRISTRHRHFPAAKEEMRETRRRLSACVGVRGAYK